MSAWDDAGYDDSWGNGGGMEAGGVAGSPGAGLPEFGGSMPDNTNQAGANNDPFAYTNGSLLTPWTGHFDSTKFGVGGGGPAPYKPFVYSDFNYNAARPAGFSETYQNPGQFTYGDYVGQGPYKGVTAKDMKADPGVQYRQDQAMKVLQASKAAQGILKTGGTLKGLQKNASDLASQEFASVDARKRRDYDASVQEGQYRYGTNRSNFAENFDRNVSNDRTGFQLRQATWKDNAANELDSSKFGYDVAQGTYDRNEAKARQGYEDLKSYENAVAAAAASGSAQAYGRALDEYKMARDEFYTNQDRQYTILNNEDNKGRDAAYQYANSQFSYGNAGAENAYQIGNANASGRVGAANATTGALGSIGQSAVDLAMLASTRNPTMPRTSVAK